MYSGHGRPPVLPPLSERLARTWAAGVATITVDHLQAIDERAFAARTAVEAVTGARSTKVPWLSAELRAQALVLCQDVVVLLHELEQLRAKLTIAEAAAMELARRKPGPRLEVCRAG